MTDDIPTAISIGDLTIVGATLKVVVLDNGQRLIEAESFRAFLEAMASPDTPPPTPDEAMALARLIKGLSA